MRVAVLSGTVTAPFLVIAIDSDQETVRSALDDVDLMVRRNRREGGHIDPRMHPTHLVCDGRVRFVGEV